MLAARREVALSHRLSGEFGRVARASAAAVVRGHDADTVIKPDHEARLRRLLRAAYTEGMPIFGQPIIDAAGKDRHQNAKFERRVLLWIEEVSMRKVTLISETTRAQLRNIVGAGRADGLGVLEIARHIRNDIGGIIGPVRARSIARTEVHSAANAAQLFAAEALGREAMKREWIAAGDERTREEHAAADGQVVALEQPFSVGGEFLMYPGDPDGSPENIIQCRCTTGFILPD